MTWHPFDLSAILTIGNVTLTYSHDCHHTYRTRLPPDPVVYPNSGRCRCPGPSRALPDHQVTHRGATHCTLHLVLLHLLLLRHGQSAFQRSLWSQGSLDFDHHA